MFLLLGRPIGLSKQPGLQYGKVSGGWLLEHVNYIIGHQLDMYAAFFLKVNEKHWQTRNIHDTQGQLQTVVIAPEMLLIYMKLLSKCHKYGNRFDPWWIMGIILGWLVLFRFQAKGTSAGTSTLPSGPMI